MDAIPKTKEEAHASFAVGVDAAIEAYGVRDPRIPLLVVLVQDMDPRRRRRSKAKLWTALRDLLTSLSFGDRKPTPGGDVKPKSRTRRDRLGRFSFNRVRHP